MPKTRGPRKTFADGLRNIDEVIAGLREHIAKLEAKREALIAGRREAAKAMLAEVDES